MLIKVSGHPFSKPACACGMDGSVLWQQLKLHSIIFTDPLLLFMKRVTRLRILLNWNDELSAACNSNLNNHPKIVGAAFSGWSSEMAADAFAFVHTGFAAVAALHDVVSGLPQAVFAYHQHDPHPISYIRVLLNIEMCRQFYGQGPWDDLEEAFKNDYDINLVNFPSVGLIKMCADALPDVARLF